MFSSIKVSLHLTIHIFQAMHTSVSLLHAKLTMGGGGRINRKLKFKTKPRHKILGVAKTKGCVWH